MTNENTHKPMTTIKSDSDGSTSHWDWTEAFAKFGFDDGDGQVETGQVEAILSEAGYKVTVEEWSMHNVVITSIMKEGVEYVPYRNHQYTFGYDDPRDYFPLEIVYLLESKFPTRAEHRFSW